MRLLRKNGFLRSPWPLLALALLGAGLRFWHGRGGAWYWDEGYLAELALDLGQGRRPHAGALWHNGLLPLTTSWLAPLSAAPFTRLYPLDALYGLRLWAALLGGVGILALGLTGRRLGGARVGLLAALFFAIGPLPLGLGSLGLYHHWASVTGMAAVAAWLATDANTRGWRAWAPYALGGLALAACYWMWWLPLGLFFAPSPSALTWKKRILLLGGPLAIVIAAVFLPAPAAALAMAKVLGGFKAGFTPEVLWRSFQHFPLVALGLAGLLALPKGKRWILVVLLGYLDVCRQRGDLHGSPYVLTPLLPWACLGLALALAWCWERSRIAALGLGILGIGLSSIGSLEWIERLSSPAAESKDLVAFTCAQAQPGDSIVAGASVNWALRRCVQAAELSQAAAADGSKAGFLPAGLGPADFAFDPALERARFLVISRTHFDSLFLDGAQGLCVLQAEREGWPLVHQNRWFKVFGNPRLGASADSRTRILHDPVFYLKAAETARERGHTALEAFARQRAQAAQRP